MDIIGTGMSGLVGSRVTALLSNMYAFTDLSMETHVDILDFPLVQMSIEKSRAPWVFHFAAYTDVQKAEEEKDRKKESISWKVNVEATTNIVSICQRTGKRLLYISTDYVFDGTKDWYEEEDMPHPLSWYGRTKYEGELAVKTLGDRSLIIRIANPYRSHPVGKKDFVHKILERLSDGQPVQTPKDQMFCPTFIDDLAQAIHTLIASQSSGVYHVVSDAPVSPYEAAVDIASCFGHPESLIHAVGYAEYFSGKALPPKQAHLKHDKINASGSKLHTFREGLLGIKNQEGGGV